MMPSHLPLQAPADGIGTLMLVSDHYLEITYRRGKPFAA